MAEAWEVAKQRHKAKTNWPSSYANSRTGRTYAPHNDDEAAFVLDDSPRHPLLKGGWGAGKSSAGVVKTLERNRRQMHGIMVSPELEHFKVSLWPAFREWCPWNMVVESQRRRQSDEWEPTKAFSMVFLNGAVLYCGGIKDATRWFGGNVHFAYFDEAARYPDASALKVLVGRARLVGPGGEPPQVFITTTPAKNWLHEYFGPLVDNDPRENFKRDSFVGTVRTEENLPNLDAGYADAQRAALTGPEAAQYLDAEWTDVAPADKFLASMLWWDRLEEDLPALDASTPIVLALDAAKGGATSTPDCFAVVAVSRHPQRRQDVAVRYSRVWKPPAGRTLDFAPIEDEVRRLCKEFAVAEAAYDEYQLHDFATRLKREGLANFKPFGQQKDRLVADKLLLDLVMGKRLAHDGDKTLRRHVDNADVKKSGMGLRLLKRTQSLKIDLAVALSMACARCLHYNL